jgi:hypothetical protein
MHAIGEFRHRKRAVLLQDCQDGFIDVVDHSSPFRDKVNVMGV